MSGSEASVEEMSFEQAMRELELVVDRLESGSAPLEESITLYERGDKLRKHCEEKLKAAELKVMQITEGADGSVAAKPAELG